MMKLVFHIVCAVLLSEVKGRDSEFQSLDVRIVGASEAFENRRRE